MRSIAFLALLSALGLVWDHFALAGRYRSALVLEAQQYGQKAKHEVDTWLHRRWTS